MQNAELCSNSGGREPQGGAFGDPWEHLGTLGGHLGTLGDHLGTLGGPSMALWRSQGPKYEKTLFFHGSRAQANEDMGELTTFFRRRGGPPFYRRGKLHPPWTFSPFDLFTLKFLNCFHDVFAFTFLPFFMPKGPFFGHIFGHAAQDKPTRQDKKWQDKICQFICVLPYESQGPHF